MLDYTVRWTEWQVSSQVVLVASLPTRYPGVPGNFVVSDSSSGNQMKYLQLQSYKHPMLVSWNVCGYCVVGMTPG